MADLIIIELDISVKIIQSEQQRENRQKKKEHIRVLWNYNKRIDICIIRVQEERKRENGIE